MMNVISMYFCERAHVSHQIRHSHLAGRDNSQSNAIANALMVSKPGHPFLIEYMEVIRLNKDNVQVVLATGPNASKEQS